jgi:molybdate transport system regulatory protein
MQKPQAHIRIDFSESCALGPGKIVLLETIERTGSLSSAARALGMSYRRAWLLLHSVNTGFTEAAVALSVGGRDGGGARLTAFGRQLVDTYRSLETAVDALTIKAFSGVRPSRTPAGDSGDTRRALRRAVAVPIPKRGP